MENGGKLLEIFDEGSWLEKEKQRESLVSAWDFDDGKKLKSEHEENCDVSIEANRHKIEHKYNEYINNQSIKSLGNAEPKREDVMWFVKDFVLLFILIIFNTIINPYLGSNASYFVIFILFLCINPGIFIWLFVFKKFPPMFYSKAVFVLSILLEIICIGIELI